MDETFNPQILAADLCELHRIYAEFFNGLTQEDWDRPVKGSPKEWNLHETVAHLYALSGAGLESTRHTLRGESYTFNDLDNRYQLNAYNRQGIDEHLHIPMKVLCAEFLDILSEAADIALNLQPGQAELTGLMAIYNRPVTIVEALGIIMMHGGLIHSAQVTASTGAPPLWKQLSPEIRHRVLGRLIRALSLLYRTDLDDSLQTTLSFKVDGLGGGSWHMDVSPEGATSGEGPGQKRGLTMHFRDTAIFCQMFTGRINLPLALLTGQLKLSGHLALFPRFGTLFSVDARSN